ncbi:MAG: hypothetical protein IJU21_03350 [Bacteroidales bacterium]|nr:hypothetical protein [Bacteroidales bacterium]
MPNIPDDYRMLDWRQKALDYDAYVFDWNAQDAVRPLIWLDKTQKNFPQNTFGLKTTVGDARQGAHNQPGHESINTIAAVMGAGLVGIDKTSQDGYNYAKMVQNYFGKTERWNIMLNNTSGTAGDWWYNMLPNLLYYAVCDIFPGVEGAEDIQRSIADQFAKADETMGDNYGYTFFNYYSMHGFTTNIPKQEDAAGGHAYILLQAYNKFGDTRYLERATNAVTVLDNLGESRFYEIIMPFGVYAAAYLNATQGTEFNVKQMLEWTFDGNRSNGRRGWGVIVDQWGPYSVYGLQGSLFDGGGYAFQMNCYEMAWPLVPMVKYAPQFARAIGKWMLNNASASRLFFPGEIDDQYQFLPEMKNLTGNIIGYEGLRKRDRYGKKEGTPMAEGDGPSWTGENPPETMFSLYSTSPIGIFGSIISTTDVEGILSLDCNVTDFYAPRPYPVHLLYNPHKESKVVSYYPAGKADLFDVVSYNYLAQAVSGIASIEIPADTAVLVVELPAGAELNDWKGHLVAERKNVIAW